MEAVESWKGYFPQDTFDKVFVGASTAFLIQTILAGPVSGLAAAGLSALATLIHSLVTPLFSYLKHKKELTWPEEVFRGSLSLIMTTSLCYGTEKIQLISDNILLYGCRVALSAFLDPNENSPWLLSWFLASRRLSASNSLCILPLSC